MAQEQEGYVIKYDLEAIGRVATTDRLRVRDGEMPWYNLEPFQPRAAVKVTEKRVDPETGNEVETQKVIVAADSTTLHEELDHDYVGLIGEKLTIPSGNGEAPEEVVAWHQACPVLGNGDSRPRPLNYRV